MTTPAAALAVIVVALAVCCLAAWVMWHTWDDVE